MAFWVIFVITVQFFLGQSPASAQSENKIYYGSRAGMTVTVIKTQGLNTTRSIIRTRHTKADAIGFCRDYIQKITPECIKDTMAEVSGIRDKLSGNCQTGEFVDFNGNQYQFEGQIRRPSEDIMAKYAIRELNSGEILDGSSASGYGVRMGIFQALCPKKAPKDD